MKTLLYTITNFSQNADDCINLLYSSLKFKDSIDFLVVSNNPAPVGFVHNTVIDTSISKECYPGFLKYSNMVPKNYDQYIYLDSDILYFGELEWLYSDKPLSIVRDNGSMLSTWFYYKQHLEEESIIMGSTQAINAGTFCFKDISFLSLVNRLYTPHISSNSSIENAILEQASYNYAVAKQYNFDLTKCYDITNITELYAANKEPVNNKYLYHFCGFRNSMITKYEEMKGFYDKYQRRNS